MIDKVAWFDEEGSAEGWKRTVVKRTVLVRTGNTRGKISSSSYPSSRLRHVFIVSRPYGRAQGLLDAL